MATILYCDRVRHVVQESRSEVDRLLNLAAGRKMCTCGPDAGCSECPPEDGFEFVYFTPEGTPPERPHQVALRASAITSFEAMPGDGI
jgi:hypothetical protein